MLAASPVIHREGDDLVASAWLDPGEDALRVMVREAGRFPGIARWYVLGDTTTLAAGAEELRAGEGIVPVAVPPDTGQSLWLPEVLRAGRKAA